MTIDSSLLTPPTSLLTTFTDPTSGQTNYAFPLQTEAWLNMQTVVATALRFPLSATDFQTSYGTFSDEATVEAAVAVLGRINTTALQYGDPSTLISQISTFAQAGTAPSSVYGAAVWLAAQTQLAAQQIASLLNEGITDIGQTADAATRITELTELLTGDGGITSYATTLQRYISAFETNTSAFYTAMNAVLTGPTDSLQVYLAQEDNVLADAKAAVASDDQQIAQLTTDITQLNKEYIGFTVAACASALMAITIIGLPLAIADAAVFGVLAAKVKAEMEAEEATRSTLDADDKCKQQLVVQLTGFNTQTLDVATDGAAFVSAIGQMISGWAEFEAQLNAQLASLTTADVQDWSAFMTQINFQSSLTAWQLIASKAEAFFNAGFVTFNPAPPSSAS